MLKASTQRGWIIRIVVGILAAIAGFLVGYREALDSIPRPPEDPAFFDVVGWALSMSDPAAMVAAIFAGLGVALTAMQLVGEKPYTADQGKKDRDHLNRTVEKLDERNVEGHAETQTSIEELKAQIAAMAAAMEGQQKAFAENFAKAAGELIESGDSDDLNAVRDIARGDAEQAGDKLLADVRGGRRREAERARQAARIFAPFAPAKAMRAYEQAVDLNPDDFWSWVELGRLRGDYEGIEQAERCFVIALQHARGDRDRMIVHNARAVQLSRAGETTRAHAEASAAHALARLHAMRLDAVPADRHDLMVSLQFMSDLEMEIGNSSAAHEHASLALAIARELHEQDDTIDTSDTLANMLNRLARLEPDSDRAKSLFNESAKLSRAAVAAHPDNKHFRRGLAVALSDLAKHLLDNRSVGEARDLYSESLAIRHSLVDADGENREWLSDLARGLTESGVAAGVAREPEVSRDFHERALELLDRLVVNDPENSRWQREMTLVLERLGDNALAQGNLEEGRRRYEESLDICRKIFRRDPHVPKSHYDLCFTLAVLIEIEVDLGENRKALGYAVQMLECAKDLTQRWPDVPRYQQAKTQAEEFVGQLAGS